MRVFVAGATGDRLAPAQLLVTDQRMAMFMQTGQRLTLAAFRRLRSCW
jgi:hypothetical protein